MSREAAKANYQLQGGDPARGFISAADATDAIDNIYDDIAAAVDGLPTSSTDNTIAQGDSFTGQIAYEIA